jgi:hypothetical protein
MITEIFHAFVDAAQAEGRSFVMIGGHAVNAHGYERTTIDLDFLVLGTDQASWKSLMARIGYKSIHETKAFIQFAPEAGGPIRIDLMTVEESTFGKLLQASEKKFYGNRHILVASILHLVALKLHACRTWDRAVQGKDYYDILNLIRIHRLDTNSEEFQEILNRYATESIRERLLSDLKRFV